MLQEASQSFASVGRPMRCSKCGTNNPSTNNFCAKCGNALAKHCAKCKAENPPTSDFCGKCGAPLTNGAGGEVATSTPQRASSSVCVAPEGNSSEALDGERKTVTALFADIKGSTELMRDLDPEEARAIVDPVLQLMMAAVHRYGGYVAQSTGDGIFAIFGAPVAHGGPSAARTACGAGDAGGVASLCKPSARRGQDSR